MSHKNIVMLETDKLLGLLLSIELAEKKNKFVINIIETR